MNITTAFIRKLLKGLKRLHDFQRMTQRKNSLNLAQIGTLFFLSFSIFFSLVYSYLGGPVVVICCFTDSYFKKKTVILTYLTRLIELLQLRGKDNNFVIPNHFQLKKLKISFCLNSLYFLL